MTKLRVGVIYGGRSGEHEVSLASAAAVFKNLDPARYEAVPIKIEKDGRWTLPARPPSIDKAADVIEEEVRRIQSGLDERRETHLVPRPGSETLVTLDRTQANATVSTQGLDVVFPVLHGPYGE